MSEYVCGSLLVFDDQSAQGMILHRGGRESCDKVADMIPAVSYNGEKRIAESRLLIMPEEEWNSMWEQPNQARESDNA